MSKGAARLEEGFVYGCRYAGSGRIYLDRLRASSPDEVPASLCQALETGGRGGCRWGVCAEGRRLRTSQPFGKLMPAPGRPTASSSAASRRSDRKGPTRRPSAPRTPSPTRPHPTTGPSPASPRPSHSPPSTAPFGYILHHPLRASPTGQEEAGLQSCRDGVCWTGPGIVRIFDRACADSPCISNF